MVLPRAKSDPCAPCVPPRFIVTELRGYVIRADGSGRPEHPYAHTPRSSFYVQDTLRLYEVVAVFENPLHPAYYQSRAYHRQRAERKAQRLNEWWAQEVAA